MLLDSLKILFFIVSFVGFVLFVGAYFTHFKESKEKGKGLRLIQILAVPTYFLHLYFILIADKTVAFFIVRALFSVVLALISVVVFLAAIKTTKNTGLFLAFCKDVPMELVQRGPYKYIRHPLYASYLYMYWSGLAFTVSYSSLFVCLVMTAIYNKAAQEEDRLLILRFGSVAVNFIKSKPKFIPILIFSKNLNIRSEGSLNDTSKS